MGLRGENNSRPLNILLRHRVANLRSVDRSRHREN